MTLNRDFAANYLNDGLTDVLTRNEGGAYLEAIVYVVVMLGDSNYSAIQSPIFLYRQSRTERLAELRGVISLYCKV